MQPEEIRDKLKNHKIVKVAEATELSLSTVYNFMHQRSEPTYKTVQVLTEYLKSQSI